MIVTRNWLEEWIELDNISTSKLIETFNKIGLEVAEYKKIKLPEKVVIGRVISCQKHPNADKLNVCEVNVGTDTLQIVCGAKNVVNAEYVAVATVGSVLPGEFKIKPAKLRGVESYGMICSSKELGLPEMGDGIMILDESIGKLEPGKELGEYPIFQDEIIEIELTANRGDCLSVLGIARELSAAFNKPVKMKKADEDSNIRIGIGRLVGLNIEGEIDSNLLYKAFGADNFQNPFLIRFRNALSMEKFTNEGEAFAYYVTYNTGVIMRSYGHSFFAKNSTISIKKDENSYDSVYGDEKGSIVGVYQYENSKPKRDEGNFILEASFIDPVTISKKMFEHPLQSDWVYYRSSRGSDPRLSIGVDYAKYLLSTLYPNIQLYSGTHEAIKEVESKAIKVEFEKLYSLIGQTIDKNQIVDILKALGFEIVNVNEESMVVKTPLFRHDIANIQDVAEEIVRIYGIDNIQPKPLVFKEANRLTKAYEDFQKKKMIRYESIAAGFFETVSYIFTNKEKLHYYGLDTLLEDLDLINPITKELDTLRTSLVPNLLDQVIGNIRNGQKRVMLFEIGTVFDKQRNERTNIAFVHSGYQEPDFILNRGKPLLVEFGGFVKELSAILGDLELKRIVPKYNFMHPFQSAALYKNGNQIGYVTKLHTTMQEELDLPPTYICEIDYSVLNIEYPKAKKYSVYQTSIKDMSILLDKNIEYDKIKQKIQESLPQEVKRFYPIDLYEDRKLGDKKSLTLRFAIQSDEKTLTEEEITKIMDQILKVLEGMGAQLR